FEFALGVRRVERRDDCRELPGRELGDDELRAVREQEADAIAAFDTERRQGHGERVAQPIEFTVAEPSTFEQQSCVVRPPISMFGHIFEERAVRVRLEARWNTRVVSRQPRSVGKTAFSVRCGMLSTIQGAYSGACRQTNWRLASARLEPDAPGRGYGP